VASSGLRAPRNQREPPLADLQPAGGQASFRSPGNAVMCSRCSGSPGLLWRNFSQWSRAECRSGRLSGGAGRASSGPRLTRGDLSANVTTSRTLAQHAHRPISHNPHYFYAPNASMVCRRVTFVSRREFAGAQWISGFRSSPSSAVRKHRTTLQSALRGTPAEIRRPRNPPLTNCLRSRRSKAKSSAVISSTNIPASG